MLAGPGSPESPLTQKLHQEDLGCAVFGLHGLHSTRVLSANEPCLCCRFSCWSAKAAGFSSSTKLPILTCTYPSELHTYSLVHIHLLVQQDVLNEVERNLHDAMGVARNIVLQPSLVPGGGAVEMEISRVLGGERVLCHALVSFAGPLV